jgi:hypothetical protein
MMRTAAVHHGYQLLTEASGYVATGTTVRFIWDGEHWTPTGRPDSPSQRMGTLTDTQLRERLHPDLETLLRLGGHWRSSLDTIRLFPEAD